MSKGDVFVHVSFRHASLSAKREEPCLKESSTNIDVSCSSTNIDVFFRHVSFGLFQMSLEACVKESCTNIVKMHKYACTNARASLSSFAAQETSEKNCKRDF